MGRIIVRNINPRPQKRIKNMGFSNISFDKKNAYKISGQGAVPKGYAKGSRMRGKEM